MRPSGMLVSGNHFLASIRNRHRKVIGDDFRSTAKIRQPPEWQRFVETCCDVSSTWPNAFPVGVADR
jgi:hypothetical protein